LIQNTISAPLPLLSADVTFPKVLVTAGDPPAHIDIPVGPPTIITRQDGHIVGAAVGGYGVYAIVEAASVLRRSGFTAGTVVAYLNKTDLLHFYASFADPTEVNYKGKKIYFDEIGG